MSDQPLPTAAPPVISPDGRQYWNGQSWVPLPGRGPAPLPAGYKPPPAGLTTLIVFGTILLLVAGAWWWISTLGYDVAVTHWSVGSADVAGTIKNNGSEACSNPQITLHLFDHNGAKVRDFTFGLAELPGNASRSWSTHMVGFLNADDPAEANVTRIDANATCLDQH